MKRHFLGNTRKVWKQNARVDEDVCPEKLFLSRVLCVCPLFACSQAEGRKVLSAIKFHVIAVVGAFVNKSEPVALLSLNEI